MIRRSTSHFKHMCGQSGLPQDHQHNTTTVKSKLDVVLTSAEYQEHCTLQELTFDASHEKSAPTISKHQDKIHFNPKKPDVVLCRLL